jgi:hypothetical protein
MPDLETRVFEDTIFLTPPRDGTMMNPHMIEDAFRAINAVTRSAESWPTGTRQSN